MDANPSKSLHLPHDGSLTDSSRLAMRPQTIYGLGTPALFLDMHSDHLSASHFTFHDVRSL